MECISSFKRYFNLEYVMKDKAIDKLYRELYGLFPWMPSQILIHEEFENDNFKAGNATVIVNNVILNMMNDERL